MKLLIITLLLLTPLMASADRIADLERQLQDITRESNARVNKALGGVVHHDVVQRGSDDTDTLTKMTACAKRQEKMKSIYRSRRYGVTLITAIERHYEYPEIVERVYSNYITTYEFLDQDHMWRPFLIDCMAGKI